MKITSFKRETQLNEINKALQVAEKGRFYQITRHYVVSTNDNRVHDVALTIFERIRKFFEEIRGKNYWESVFKDKKPTLLSTKTAGLPVNVPGKPAPKEDTSASKKPAGSSSPGYSVEEMPKPTKTEGVAPSTQPKSIEDEATQRIISWQFSLPQPSELPSLADTRKTADQILPCITAKTCKAYRHPNLGKDEGYVDLAAMRKRPGCEKLDEKGLEIALNYLVLTDRIGYYTENMQKTRKVCINPQIKSLPGIEVFNRDWLLKIDKQMQSSTKPLYEFLDFLAKQPSVEPSFMELIHEIEPLYYRDAINGDTFQIKTDMHGKLNWLDLLIEKGVIFSWAIHNATEIHVALTEGSQTLKGNMLWRTGKDIRRERDEIAAFNQTHHFDIVLPSSDEWSPQELTALTACVQRLNERGRPGPCPYTFQGFSEGHKIATYLKEAGKIQDFTFTPQTPKDFMFFVNEEDVLLSPPPPKQ